MHDTKWSVVDACGLRKESQSVDQGPFCVEFFLFTPRVSLGVNRGLKASYPKARTLG